MAQLSPHSLPVSTCSATSAVISRRYRAKHALAIERTGGQLASVSRCKCDAQRGASNWKTMENLRRYEPESVFSKNQEETQARYLREEFVRKYEDGKEKESLSQQLNWNPQLTLSNNSKHSNGTLCASFATYKGFVLHVSQTSPLQPRPRNMFRQRLHHVSCHLNSWRRSVPTDHFVTYNLSRHICSVSAMESRTL